jgi:hypothetical protein
MTNFCDLCRTPVRPLKKSISVKAAFKIMMKLTPGIDLTNILRSVFTFVDPKGAKKAAKSLVILHFWDLLE